MSIEEDIRRSLADKTIKEQSAYISAAREIMGLREQRTLSQILENQTLNDRTHFNLALAASATFVAQLQINVYLRKRKPQSIIEDPVAQQLTTNVTDEELDFALFYAIGGLQKFADLPENTFDAITHRIQEQQTNSLINLSPIPTELQLFLTSFELTFDELTTPDDSRIHIDKDRVEARRRSYEMQKRGIPEKRVLQIIAFPNELRQAVGLQPLT